MVGLACFFSAANATLTDNATTAASMAILIMAFPLWCARRIAGRLRPGYCPRGLWQRQAGGPRSVNTCTGRSRPFTACSPASSLCASSSEERPARTSSVKSRSVPSALFRFSTREAAFTASPITDAYPLPSKRTFEIASRQASLAPSACRESGLRGTIREGVKEPPPGGSTSASPRRRPRGEPIRGRVVSFHGPGVDLVEPPVDAEPACAQPILHGGMRVQMPHLLDHVQLRQTLQAASAAGSAPPQRPPGLLQPAPPPPDLPAL